MTRRLGIVANAAGVACIMIGIIKRGQTDLEGVYINRSVGEGTSAFAVSQPNIVPWLVAAIALVVVGPVLMLRRS